MERALAMNTKPVLVILEEEVVKQLDDLVLADRRAGRTLRGASKARVTRSSVGRALIIRALSLLDCPADLPNGTPIDKAA